MEHPKFEIATIGLTEVEGEARAFDLDLANRLGYSNPLFIRKLIRTNREEIERHGVLFASNKTPGSKGGRPAEEFWLTEAQTLCVAQLSGTEKASEVRTMLIKVFVAWRRGALDPVGISPNQMGGIFKSILHKELATRLPEMVKAEIAAAQYEVVRGVTAGKVIEMAGVKDKRGTKGLAQIVSNILRRYHAAKGVAVKLAELGMHTAYVFDPATAREWLASGGKETILARIAEKRGQTSLRLVPGA